MHKPAKPFLEAVPVPPQPKVVGNPAAPDVLATGFAGIANIAGIIQITFDCMRADHSRSEPVIERVIAARVALPTPVAQALVTELNSFLEGQGLSPSRAMTMGAALQ